MSSKKSDSKQKGKLLYHSTEQMKKRVGDASTDVIEKTVTHAEDTLFCKLYEKKNGVVTKVTVKSGGAGGEYTFTVKKGDSDAKVTQMKKKDLVDTLKKDANLSFMLEYIDKAKSLARSTKGKTKSKTKSKSKSKSQSKSKGKKSKSK